MTPIAYLFIWDLAKANDRYLTKILVAATSMNEARGKAQLVLRNQLMPCETRIVSDYEEFVEFINTTNPAFFLDGYAIDDYPDSYFD